MKLIFSFFLRGFLSFNISIITWFITFFGFDLSFWMSALLGILGGGITYFFLKWRGKQKLLKKNQLTRKEFQYIISNLNEAKAKINRLNKALFGIRSIQVAKQIGKLQRLASRIYQVVKKEPKRFYYADRFFFYHLDSIVELSERYVFLSRQPVQNQEVHSSLAETEQTLDKLVNTIEEDLLMVLSNDINHLNVELDVANHEIKRQNNLLPEERR